MTTSSLYGAWANGPPKVTVGHAETVGHADLDLSIEEITFLDGGLDDANSESKHESNFMFEDA